MAVYTSRVRGRVRAMYTAEDVRADDPYTVMYTGGVDGHGPYTAVYGPCIRYGLSRFDGLVMLSSQPS